ncbi:MAG TPA: TonB-dependent receptor [Allosphingosinicella sp.]|jgi:iron complex outermembrane receptor protein
MNKFCAASAATIVFCLVSAKADAQVPGGVVAQPGPTDETVGSTAVTTDPAAQTPAEETGLEDIVVTAQRRDERLQDVPVAVSVVSGDFLIENQVRSLQDLGATVPGLVVTNSVNYGSAPLSIRGIGGANGGGNVFADEPVAVYVDDAYVSRLRLSTADLIDIGGIEVLRGPQGTLYGRNSTAGAVLLRSAEPTEEISGRGSIAYDTIDTFRAQAALSGALNEAGTVTARIAGGFSDRGGWGTNRSGPQLNTGRDWQVRAFLRFRPTDALTIDLIGDLSYSRSEPGTIAISDTRALRDEVTNPTGSNTVFPYVLRPDLDSVRENNRFDLNFRTYSITRGRNVTGRINYEFDTVTLTSVTNYREWDQIGSQDSDGTGVNPPNPPFVGGPPITNVGSNFTQAEDSQFSQELRLASTGDGPFTWLVGGFYFAEKNIVDPVSITNNLAGPGGGGTLVVFRADQLTHNWAAFANIAYAITDTVKLSLGGRYSEETKRFSDTQSVTLIRQFDPPGPAFFAAGQTLLAPPVLNLRRKDTNFAPRVVLDWKATPDVLLYASFSKGFKSGGFNVFRGNNPVFEPEKIDAYEVGLKSDLSSTLRLNASAFRYDYQDLQVRTPVPSGGVGIESAAEARSQGVEIETTYAPMRGLRFDANATFLDAKFRRGTLSAVQAQSYVFGTNPAVTPENIAGNRLARAPKFQFAVNGRYGWNVGSALKASVQGSVRHQSRVFFLETQQQAPTFRGSAWEEVDARISIGERDENWTVSLFVKNAFDDRHFSQVAAFFGLPNGALNEPRRFGAQLDLNF